MKSIKRLSKCLIVLLAIVAFAAIFTTVVSADTAEDTSSVTATEQEQETGQDDTVKSKAIAAAAVIGLAASAGAIGMSIAIAKSVEGIARQPEADGKIRTSLMLGLVFVETAIIYALIIAVLIIFVL